MSSTNSTTISFSQATFAFVFAVVASAALCTIYFAPKSLLLVLVGAIFFVLAFAFSGNQRLFSLWGLILTAPLEMRKAFWISAHMGGASAITIDLVDVFIALLLFFIIRDYVAGRRRSLRFSRVAFWWGGLALLTLIDVIIGPLRHLAALELIRMAKCYLLFFVIINEVVRARQFLHVFTALVVGVAIEAILAIIQFLFKANLGLQKLGEATPESAKYATKTVYLGHGDIFRAGGLFSHPNLLAGYMALLLPICIALLFSRLSVLSKLVVGIIVGLGAAALVITLSRSAWISFGVGFGVLMIGSLFHQRLRTRFLMIRIAILVAAAIALATASGAILKRINDSDPGSLSFRYEMMDVAWRMIGERPIFGKGANSFVAYLPYYYDKYPGPKAITGHFGDDWPVVHDSYLITWTEQGTVGLVLLLGLYYSILSMAVRTGRYFVNDVLYAMNLGAACGIIAIMVDGIGSFFIDQSASERVFWVIVGLITAIHYWTKANRQNDVGNPVPGNESPNPVASTL